MSRDSYRPEVYQDRQRRGLCATCSRRRGKGSMCKTCRVNLTAYLAAERKRARAAGICQWGKCGVATGGRTYCLKHATRRARQPSRWPDPVLPRRVPR